MTAKKKRKWRLVVDVTSKCPCTVGQAKHLLDVTLDAGRNNSTHAERELTTWKIYDFQRVLQERRKRAMSDFYDDLEYSTADIDIYIAGTGPN